jgi:predicted helicase
MFRLRRKPKKPIVITKEDIRDAVKEELLASDENKRKYDDEEKQKLLRQKRLQSLPPHVRLKLLRYFAKRKGVSDGKK